MGLGDALDSGSSHCSSAASARYEYVPGGSTFGMRDNFVSRCESSDRDVLTSVYGN